MKINTYIEMLLTEEYPEVASLLNQEPETVIALAARQEIHKHRWYEGTRGCELSWEQAREEWVGLYFDSFKEYLLNNKYGCEFFGECLCSSVNHTVYHGYNQNFCPQHDTILFYELSKLFYTSVFRLKSAYKEMKRAVYLHLKKEFGGEN